MKRFQIDSSGIFDVKGGDKKKVRWFEDILKKLSSCCGLDCCSNLVRIKDKGNGEKMVGYFFNGAWVVETEAAYEVKKEAGTFNY